MDFFNSPVDGIEFGHAEQNQNLFAVKSISARPSAISCPEITHLKGGFHHKNHRNTGRPTIA
jgi:hypothetical protein